MSTIKIVTEHKNYAVITDDTGKTRQLQLRHEPGNDTVRAVQLSDGRTCLGYLIDTDQCENPMTANECEGNIYTCHKHASREEHETFREYLQKPTVFVVLLSRYSHSGEVWAICGSPESRSWADQRWDVSHGVAVWVADKGAQENIMASAKTMLKRVRKKADREKIIRPLVLRYCEGVLELYNNWLGGECYDVVLETFTINDCPEDDDSVERINGIIGREYAIQARDDLLDERLPA